MLLILAVESPVHADGTWTNQAPPSAAPSAREEHAITYLGGDQVLLFGGDTGSDVGDTWLYDLSNTTWSNQTPPAAPSARPDHAMSSLGGDQVLLFGGSTGGIETWVYDLSDNTWTNQAPANAPSARAYHAMAYLGVDHVLLFSGWGDGENNETWLATGFYSGWYRQYLPLVMK